MKFSIIKALCILFVFLLAQKLEANDIESLRQRADEGVPEAQNELGLRYHMGNGVNQSYEEAFKWYTKAAEQGNAQAEYNVSVCYAKGKGVSKSPEEAFKWVKKSAEHGIARAQCAVGEYYARGIVVPKSKTEAFSWYQKAARQGLPDAQYKLGLCFLYGSGTIQSSAEALKWFHKAAEQGYALAQYAIGQTYAKGIGVITSHESAIIWYQKAAEQNNAAAQYYLGVAYANGQGIEQSYEEAAKWFHKAAESNHMLAQYSLGVYYAYGLGVKPSAEESKKWHSKIKDKTVLSKVLAEPAPDEIQPSPAAIEWSGSNNTVYEMLLTQKRGVCRIYAKTNEGICSGTGFLISKEEGLVATCNHVVQGASDISIFVLSEDELTAREYPAKIVTTSPTQDLAIIKFKTQPISLPEPFELSTTAASVLEEVVAIGFPAILDQYAPLEVHKQEDIIQNPKFINNLTPNVTKGTISKAGTQIIHDAKIAEGNSGGPLVSLKTGKVVGINTAKINGATEFYIAAPSYQAAHMLSSLLEFNTQIRKLENLAAYSLPDATLKLAIRLHTSIDKDKTNNHRELLLLTRASELAHPDALYYMGLWFLDAKQLQQNVNLAILLLKKSGTEQAKETLCEIYSDASNKEGYNFNKEEAFQFIKNFAESGNSTGKRALAHCYRHGIGTKKNIDEAIRILRQLVDEISKIPGGNTDIAKMELANTLLDSQKREATNEAIHILKILATSPSSYIRGKACAELGNLYFDGRKIKADMKLSAYYYKIGTEAKNTICMANLGTAYIQGNRGVEKNPPLGIELIYESINLGCSKTALSFVGNYLIEIGQYEQGVQHLQQAAEAGCNVAAGTLAVYHYYGKFGVKKDRKKAETIVITIAEDPSDPNAQQMAKKLIKHWGLSSKKKKKNKK